MKIIFRILLLTVIALGLNEICFSQDQPPKADKAVESSIPPSSSPEVRSGIADKTQDQPTGSLIYFYRLKAFVGSALEPLILCDEKEIAKMDNGRYFAISLEPGKHSCYIGDKKSGFEVDIKAGESRYVKITLEAGFWKGHGIMTMVQPEQATFELKKLKLLGANKIKDHDAVTIFEGAKP